MSRPFVTVDYFSHDWHALDLGCATQELRRQSAEVHRKLMEINHVLDNQHEVLRQWGLCSPKTTSRPLHQLSREKHRLLSDAYRLARLSNVVWRQHKARGAPKVDPMTINWQKTSDIIWLYGPLYRRDESDVDFEKRHGCPEMYTKASPSSERFVSDPDLQCVRKPILKKRQETKLEYVARQLGRETLNKYRRRSIPLDCTMASTMDIDRAMATFREHSRARGKKEIHFKPEVLEYIYHAELPIRGRRVPAPPPSPPPSPPFGGCSMVKAQPNRRMASAAPSYPIPPVMDHRRTEHGRHPLPSSSAACHRAKILLHAARSQPKTSPPLQRPPPKDIRPNPKDRRMGVDEPSVPNTSQKRWFWPFSGQDDLTPPPSPTIAPTSTPNTETSLPGLCASLVSLSAEMVTLMGTAAIYKGVGYGLGCMATQQPLGVHSTKS